MKQPYKVQNRTSESRRVKFVKNGGVVSFPKTPTASFVENSREAGFCLSPISPLPAQENPTDTITITAHPMGVDGRVSLIINDVLIESKRYSGLNRIVNRQDWFNQEFGAYVEYSGKELPTFTLVSDSTDIYRFVFEDDDLDYQFGDFKLATSSTNPSLFVEQYRLAFGIKKIEISCEGAPNFIEVEATGQFNMYIDGVLVGTGTLNDLKSTASMHDIEITEYVPPPPPPQVNAYFSYTSGGEPITSAKEGNRIFLNIDTTALELPDGYVLTIDYPPGISATDEYDFEYIPPPPPVNDTPQGALVLQGTSGTLQVSNEAATYDDGVYGMGGNSGSSMWYRFTATANGNAQIDTIGSGWDTVLGIYISTIDPPINSELEMLTSNDDGGGGGTSQCNFEVTAGTTYWIGVGGYGGRTGILTLNWSIT